MGGAGTIDGQVRVCPVEGLPLGIEPGQGLSRDPDDSAGGQVDQPFAQGGEIQVQMDHKEYREFKENLGTQVQMDRKEYREFKGYLVIQVQQDLQVQQGQRELVIQVQQDQ